MLRQPFKLMVALVEWAKKKAEHAPPFQEYHVIICGKTSHQQ